MIEIITDEEYVYLVKLWKSSDPVDSNEMVDMIEYCIEKYSLPAVTDESKQQKYALKDRR